MNDLSTPRTAKISPLPPPLFFKPQEILKKFHPLDIDKKFEFSLKCDFIGK